MATSKIKKVDAFDEVYYGWGTTNSNGFLKLSAPHSGYVPIGAISAQTGKIATVAYRDDDNNKDFWLLFTDTALHPLASTSVAVYVLFMPYANHNLL